MQKMKRRVQRAESSQYCGELIDGKREGKGHEFSDCGDLVYSGAWKHDKYCGLGVLYHNDGIPKFNGVFCDGKPVHVTEFDHRSRPIFEGKMKDGKKISGIIWTYESEHRDWATETQSDTFEDNLPSHKGDKFWRANRFAPLFSYEGELVKGQEHGTGELHLDGILLYKGGFFAGKFHGIGQLTATMRYVSDPLIFHGEFVHGHCSFGKITTEIKDEVYEGQVKFSGNEITCHGKGKTCKDGFVLEGHWINGEFNSNEDLQLTWDNFEARGKISEYIPGFRFEFQDSQLFQHGIKVFCGSFHVHPSDKKVCRIQGTVFVNGKPRAECIFVEDEVDLITTLYDEDGHMCLMSQGGQMSGLKDGWPEHIEGDFKVHTRGSDFMYRARFQDGAIRNLMEVANSTPVTLLHLHESPQDIITMESIASGSIAYALNSNYHLVTKETLQALKSSKNLSRHPYTRAPVMRIYRVLIKTTSSVTPS